MKVSAGFFETAHLPYKCHLYVPRNGKSHLLALKVIERYKVLPNTELAVPVLSTLLNDGDSAQINSFVNEGNRLRQFYNAFLSFPDEYSSTAAKSTASRPTCLERESQIIDTLDGSEFVVRAPEELASYAASCIKRRKNSLQGN